MVYTINYTVWVVVCAFITCLVFLRNFKKRWLTGFLVILMCFIMYLPNMFTTTDQTVIDYKQVVRDFNEAKILDGGRLLSFKDENYVLNNDLLELDNGFYDNVTLLEVKELQFKLNHDIILKVYKNTTLKFIYVNRN